MSIKKSKTSLSTGEGVAKVFALTNQGNVYEADPAEIVAGSIPEAALGAHVSTYELEQSSSPAFEVFNRGAAELYQSHMGGYMMLCKDGKVYAAKLNPSDWDKFADGTPVGDASRFETMIHVPQCNFKADGKKMYFGGLVPVDGGQSFGCPEWVGAYEMYVDASNVGHSRPDVAPSHSKTMTTFWQCAQRLGSQFGLANYGFHCLINALFQARYGNLNSQEIIGPGFQHSNWSACRDVPMGLTRKLGDGSGMVSYMDETLGTQYPVKLFGFEDLWGKLWEFRPGIRFYMDGSVRKAVVYDGNQVSDIATGREFTVAVASASGSYVKSMHLGTHWDMIPQMVSGSAITYYTDGCWAATTGALLAVGGLSYDGSYCGLSFAASNGGFSNSYAYYGGRLAFWGVPEIVSGSALVAMVA